MMEMEPAAGNRINWPFAIAASVVCHAVVIGSILLASSGGSADARAARDGGRRGAEQPAAAGADTAGGGEETPAPAAPDSSPGGEAGGESPASAATSVYVVKGGDNLTRIARRHGCTAEDIAALNGFAVSKPLNIGERLKVPAQSAQ